MANIYYSRKLPNGTIRPAVGPFSSTHAARRAIGQAMIDNGYARTPAEHAPFTEQFARSDPGPFRHAGSGVVYVIHTGTTAPASLADW